MDPVILTGMLLVVLGCAAWPGPLAVVALRHRSCESRPGTDLEDSQCVVEHATVEQAAAALALVAVALRSGVGAIEALEAVAHVDGTPAGHELSVVAAAHRWGEASEDAWRRVGTGWAPAAAAWHGRKQLGGCEKRSSVVSRRRCSGQACCWCSRWGSASCRASSPRPSPPSSCSSSVGSPRRCRAGWGRAGPDACAGSVHRQPSGQASSTGRDPSRSPPADQVHSGGHCAKDAP